MRPSQNILREADATPSFQRAGRTGSLTAKKNDMAPPSNFLGKEWLVRQVLSFLKCALSLVFLVLQISHDVITTSMNLMKHDGEKPYHLSGSDSSSMAVSSSSLSPERESLQQYSSRRSEGDKKKKKKVVVVGGSFAGLAAIRDLNRYDNELDILLIDNRDWFEYIPGILRAFCDASYAPRIIRKRTTTLKRISLGRIAATSSGERQLLEHKGFLQATAKRIENNQVIVSTIDNDGTSSSEDDSNVVVPFDYLVVATGSNYKHPITPSGLAATNYQERLHSFEKEEGRIKNAKSILILGGGPVGVELAAEIIDHFPSKDVTIIQGQNRLLPSFPMKTSVYAEKWLCEKNVCVMLNKRLSSYNESECKTTSGEVYSADLVYVCFGMKPNSDVILASQASTKGAQYKYNSNRSCRNDNDNMFDQSGFVLVNDALQIKEGLQKSNNASNIFVIGDVASHSLKEMKQAYYAEAHGHVVAKNILAMTRASATTTLASNSSRDTNIHEYSNDAFVKSYPEGFTGYESKLMPLVYVVSLGRYDGSLGFNNFVLNGPLASLLKWIIEYTKVMQMEGKAVGELIWWIGDKVTLWISRYILPPPEPQWKRNE